MWMACCNPPPPPPFFDNDDDDEAEAEDDAKLRFNNGLQDDIDDKPTCILGGIVNTILSQSDGRSKLVMSGLFVTSMKYLKIRRCEMDTKKGGARRATHVTL